MSDPLTGPVAAPTAAPLTVVLSLGTDHHRFDRAVDWVDSWIDGFQGEVRLTAQVGTSKVSRHGTSHQLMPPQDLQAAMADADVVVCHGGPATIIDARRAGRLPVVIPRDSSLDEHVDDHQQRFAGWMAARQQVLLVRTEADLCRALDGAVTDPSTTRCDAGADATQTVARRFGELVEGLLG